MRLTRRDRILLFAPATVLIAGGLLLPAVLGLTATFTTYSPFSPAVRFSGLSNYAAVLGDHLFAAAVRNIIVFTVFAVPLELLIGFGLAYVLWRPIRGRRLWRVLLLMPWLVSPIANGVMWHFLFGSTRGIVDFAVGSVRQPDLPSPIGDVRLALAATIAVEVWRISPLVTFLLLPGLSSIPPERWEDAILNGASWIRTVLHVALPSMRPLLLATTMLLIGLSLGTFDSVLILTGGGPGTSTITPALYSYSQAFSANDWPAGGASAWLIAADVLGVGLVYLRLVPTRPIG
ncbi:MAG TPA: sugar ABC transporter permease [Candidatus Dormibacteraeota bacterium]|jgi:multiple sugar transport system permease protein